ncbi:hypothetical protein CCP2SC5_20102 [Azospirillaceae bacterium]
MVVFNRFSKLFRNDPRCSIIINKSKERSLRKQEKLSSLAPTTGAPTTGAPTTGAPTTGTQSLPLSKFICEIKAHASIVRLIGVAVSSHDVSASEKTHPLFFP